jgi:putative transposase
LIQFKQVTNGHHCYQNACAERLNGILKVEFLFLPPDNLALARLLVEQAAQLYNQERPHLALQLLHC